MVRKTLALSLSPPPWRAHPVKTFFATRRHERGADDKAAVGVDGKGRRQPRPLQSCARLLELLRPSHRELAQPRMVTSFFLQGILLLPSSFKEFCLLHIMCGAVATSSANTLRHLGPYEGFNMVIAMDCLAAAPPGHQFACGSPMKFGATVPKPTDRFFSQLSL